MAPKRKLSDTSNESGSVQSANRAKKVMTLLQKVQVLDTLASGMGASSVGRLFGVNESTVRYIKKIEERIRDFVARSSPGGAKICVARDKDLVATEKALSSWIQDLGRKNVYIDQTAIRKKALSLYEEFRKVRGGEVRQQTFTASKGWLQKFKRRFPAHNGQIPGQTALNKTVHSHTS
jgi:hypothetical protein